MTTFITAAETDDAPLKMVEPVNHHLAGDLVDRTFLEGLTTPTSKLVRELCDNYPGVADSLSRSRNWIDLVLALDRAEEELERSEI